MFVKAVLLRDMCSSIMLTSNMTRHYHVLLAESQVPRLLCLIKCNWRKERLKFVRGRGRGVLLYSVRLKWGCATQPAPHLPMTFFLSSLSSTPIVPRASLNQHASLHSTRELPILRTAWKTQRWCYRSRCIWSPIHFEVKPSSFSSEPWTRTMLRFATC
jgi:hypothetical protein